MKDWTNDEVVELHRRYITEDASVRDLGREEGVSYETIRQLFKDHGLSTEKPRRTTRVKVSHELEAFKRREEILEVYRRTGNLEVTSKEIGLPIRYIRVHIPDADRLYYRNKGVKDSYTIEQRREFLRRAAEVCGEPLTLPKYNAVAPDMGLPAQMTITSPYNGDWYEACKDAGVMANPPRGKRANSITPEDCMAGLRAYYEANGRQVPSYNQYNMWAKETSYPSGGSVRSKFVKWREAVKATFPELYE